MKEKIELGQIFCGEYSEDCQVDRLQCPFSDCMAEVWAEEILSLGYRKIIWHKVADGNLPENYQEIRWVDNTGEYYNGTYCEDGTEERFTSDLGCDFYRDEVVAWTELPKYKE